MCYLGFPALQPAAAAAAAAAEKPASEAAGCNRLQGYSDDFMMQCFKVVECDNPEHNHEHWETCPFAHAGEVVTRRPPQTHLPKLCPKARRACRKGRACPYAHNVFEHWLHPARFKTEICQHGGSCNRPMCFFAHYPEEVRRPSPSADEVMAAAEAAGLLNRPHSQHGAHCGRCLGGCHDGGACSRRSSSTNHDSGGVVRGLVVLRLVAPLERRLDAEAAGARRGPRRLARAAAGSLSVLRAEQAAQQRLTGFF